MRRVEVEWLDSIACSDWESVESAVADAAKPNVMLHRSCGYLVADTPDYLMVALSVSADEKRVTETMQIPRVAVVSVRRVSVRRIG